MAPLVRAEVRDAGREKELFRVSGGFFPTAVQRLLLKCLLRGVNLAAFVAGGASSAPSLGPSEGVASSRRSQERHEAGEEARTADGTASSAEERQVACKPALSYVDESLRCFCFDPTRENGTSLVSASEETERQEYAAAREFVSLLLVVLSKSLAVCSSGPSSAGASDGHTETDLSRHTHQASLARFAQRVTQEFSVDQLTCMLLKLSRNLFSILSGQPSESSVTTARPGVLTSDVESRNAGRDAQLGSEAAGCLASLESSEASLSNCPCCFTDSVCAQGLYGPPISCMNHSCTYNARAVFGDGSRSRLAIRIVAIRDIQKDEEICISYVPRVAFSRARERREHLLRGYGFLCCCPLCCGCCVGAANGREAGLLRVAVAERERPSGEAGRLVDGTASREKDHDGNEETSVSTPEKRRSLEGAPRSSEILEKAVCGGNSNHGDRDLSPCLFSLSEAFDTQTANIFFCNSPQCRAVCYTPQGDALLALEDGRRLQCMAAAGRPETRGRCKDALGSQDDTCGNACGFQSSASVSGLQRKRQDTWAKHIRLRLPVRLCRRSEDGSAPSARDLVCLAPEGNRAFPPASREETKGQTATEDHPWPSSVCTLCQGELSLRDQEAVRQSFAQLPWLVRRLECEASCPELSRLLHRFLYVYKTVFPHSHPGNLLLAGLRGRVLSLFLGQPEFYIPCVLLLQEHQIDAMSAIHGPSSPEAAHELQAAGRLLLFLGEGDDTEARKAWQTWQEGVRVMQSRFFLSVHELCTTSERRLEGTWSDRDNREEYQENSLVYKTLELVSSTGVYGQVPKGAFRF
ncbi:putative zinc finger MYND domain-containing protein [Neospora caninum Liverpool]|uniref:Putative zinc finger MYND domain-containing protein n=1 Tax=Neospora caninum (strain Liverpool) TaxID=572307 RepID=F0V9R6_NEOCL|nr:putative zinc finger MYND domain-containing protein [Neospora caninum Liverpool]CBZ50227.1 putative zinc finger MYND domain-containing protein [Neospora caninum Liverpool]|eukprot:XP_003880262.1 putative zinc finger MYND domain-containing protein [Neospora caninum Liverpool]